MVIQSGRHVKSRGRPGQSASLRRCVGSRPRFDRVLLRPSTRRASDGRTMDGKVTLPALQQMKHQGRKIVGVVAYDYQIAQILDRAGVDIVSVGDSVGVNMWGH